MSVKVHVLASTSSLSHLSIVFLDRVIHFGEALGDQLKGRSPKKSKSFNNGSLSMLSESTCF